MSERREDITRIDREEKEKEMEEVVDELVEVVEKVGDTRVQVKEEEEEEEEVVVAEVRVKKVELEAILDERLVDTRNILFFLSYQKQN